MSDNSAIELGLLLDRLSEAADLLDTGAAASSETMRAVYRDVVLEAIQRVSTLSAECEALRREWCEQDQVLQSIAALCDSDEHISCVADVLTAIRRTVQGLEAECAALRAQLLEKENDVSTRVDNRIGSPSTGSTASTNEVIVNKGEQ